MVDIEETETGLARGCETPNGVPGGVEEDRLPMDSRLSVRPDLGDSAGWLSSRLEVSSPDGRGVIDRFELSLSKRVRVGSLEVAEIGVAASSAERFRGGVGGRGGRVLVPPAVVGVTMNSSPASEEKSMNESGVAGMGDIGLVDAENDRERRPRWVGRPAFGGEGDLAFVNRAPFFGVPLTFKSSTALP